MRVRTIERGAVRTQPERAFTNQSEGVGGNPLRSLPLWYVLQLCLPDAWLALSLFRMYRGGGRGFRGWNIWKRNQRALYYSLPYSTVRTVISTFVRRQSFGQHFSLGNSQDFSYLYLRPVFRIQIPIWISKFLGFPDPDPLVNRYGSGSGSFPSLSKNSKKNPDFYCFVTSLWLFYLWRMM